MEKKILYSIFLLLVIVFASTCVFAEDNNSMLQNAANGVRNVVGGAENTVENAARGISNTSRNITEGMQNAGNTAANNIGNTVNNMDNTANNGMNNDTNSTTDNNTSGFMGINSTTDEGNYNATRTATNEGTFLGLTSNTWIWMVVALAALAIGILIYSYFAQNNTRYDHSDE